MNTLNNLIGNTPLVLLEKINQNPNVKLYAKLEGQNPGGSIKDRAALYMIKTAIQEGSLKPGDTIIEATSGNTGIALAMIGKSFGVKVILVMPSNATPERIKTMKAYGAEVILTPKEKTIEYSIEWAKQEADNKGYVILDQFNNYNNLQAHINSTGPEIWKDTNGAITHFVSAMGTTGTISGTATYLKLKNADIQIIGAQPKEGNSIPGIRKWTDEYLPSIYQKDKVDKILYVSRQQAIEQSRRLASEEGIMAGMSTGAALNCALEIIDNLSYGTVVFIACDRGDRYLSSELFI